jgi:hypothetical protein
MAESFTALVDGNGFSFLGQGGDYEGNQPVSSIVGTLGNVTPRYVAPSLLASATTDASSATPGSGTYIYKEMTLSEAARVYWSLTGASGSASYNALDLGQESVSFPTLPTIGKERANTVTESASDGESNSISNPSFLGSSSCSVFNGSLNRNNLIFFLDESGDITGFGWERLLEATSRVNITNTSGTGDARKFVALYSFYQTNDSDDVLSNVEVDGIPLIKVENSTLDNPDGILPSDVVEASITGLNFTTYVG